MFIPNTDPKSASRPCWHRGDDTQRSQGEYSKYGHDKLTAHEESADKEISILTIPPSKKRNEKTEAERYQVAGNVLKNAEKC